MDDWLKLNSRNILKIIATPTPNPSPVIISNSIPVTREKLKNDDEIIGKYGRKRRAGYEKKNKLMEKKRRRYDVT